MPEGRQRAISKGTFIFYQVLLSVLRFRRSFCSLCNDSSVWFVAGNPFKGRTNETSECEEHGDEDDESAVNAFIEASCYNLRQLILGSVRKSGSNLPNNIMHKVLFVTIKKLKIQKF